MPIEAVHALVADEMSRIDFAAGVPEGARALAAVAQDRFRYIIAQALDSRSYDSDDGHTIIEEIGEDKSIPTMLKEKIYATIAKQATAMAVALGAESVSFPKSAVMGEYSGIKEDATKAAAAMLCVRALARAHTIFDRTAGSIPFKVINGEIASSTGATLEWAAGLASLDGTVTVKAIRANQYLRDGMIARPTHAFSGKEAEVFLHEITHIQHYNAPRTSTTGASRRPTGQSDPKWHTPLTAEQVRIARGEGMGAKIRDYGLSNPREYVTCMIEKLDVGGTFTEAQWKLYDEFNGPRVRPDIRKQRTRTRGRDPFAMGMEDQR
jgi:hypothetical protein